MAVMRSHHDHSASWQALFTPVDPLHRDAGFYPENLCECMVVQILAVTRVVAHAHDLDPRIAPEAGRDWDGAHIVLG